MDIHDRPMIDLTDVQVHLSRIMPQINIPPPTYKLISRAARPLPARCPLPTDRE